MTEKEVAWDITSREVIYSNNAANEGKGSTPLTHDSFGDMFVEVFDSFS
jgi:hypothetical protein